MAERCGAETAMPDWHARLSAVDADRAGSIWWELAVEPEARTVQMTIRQLW